MKKLLSLLGACAVCGSMYAQSSDYPWAFGLFGGRTEYNGEYGNHFFDFGRNSSNHLFGAKFYGHGALSVERYLNKNFDAMFLGSYGYYGAESTSSINSHSSLNTVYTHSYLQVLVPVVFSTSTSQLKNLHRLKKVGILLHRLVSVLK